METIEYRAAAAGHSAAVEEWLTEFDTAFAAIAGRFSRVEPRRQARSFLLGLLSDADSRSCWQLAKQAGDTSPHAMQRLLGEARNATVSSTARHRRSRHPRRDGR